MHIYNHTVMYAACTTTKCSLHKGTTLMQILPLCYLHLVAASRSYTCAQDGLDTAQLALVVFFLPPTSENTPLAVMVVITCCNLRWWCFSVYLYIIICIQQCIHACVYTHTHSCRVLLPRVVYICCGIP